MDVRAGTATLLSKLSVTVYLDAGGTLAVSPHIISTILSHAINSGFGKILKISSTNNCINEVKDKLRDGGAENSTLLGIAFDYGLNSKATFNRAFKKMRASRRKILRKC